MNKKQSTVFKPRIRILLDDQIALGPGKVELLEAISMAGSLSAAARSIRLSYKRAWDLVHTMNSCFQKPLVELTKGGKGGGGACLTVLGREVLALYRVMEVKAVDAVALEIEDIRRHLAS